MPQICDILGKGVYKFKRIENNKND